MQDLLAIGEAWFETQRRQHLAVEVEYQPSGGLPRICRATLVTGKWEAVDSSGNVVRYDTRDFFIHRDELPQDPKRGDRVVVTENGQEKTYQVQIPPGGQNPWRWSDRNERIRRIHTMAVAGTAAVPGTSLFVRAVGASTASAITDAQIKSQLALDLGTTKVLERQVAAAAAYVYVVLPDAFGEPLIRVNGLVNTAWELTTRSITFDGQPARPYRVYRSTYAVTGTILVQVS